MLPGFMATLFSLASCVDKDYDFSKDIDTTIGINADVSFPVGNSEFIAIGDFFKLDEDCNDSIIKDGEGNYMISFASDEPVRMSVDLQEISFESQSLKTVQVGFSGFSPEIVGMTPSSFPAGIQTEYNFSLKISDSQTGGQVDPSMDIEVDTELPEEVVDLFWADVNSEITFNFEVDNGKITLNDDIVITFPDFMTLDKPASASGYSVDKNIVRLSDAFGIQHGVSSSIRLLVTKIDLTGIENHGIVEDSGTRRLIVDDMVRVTGTANVDARDFSPVPSGISLSMFVGVENIAVDRAKVRLDINETFDRSEVTLDGIPDLFEGDDILLDFYNPVVWLDIDNGSVLTAELNADIASYSADVMNAGVHIGADGPVDNRTEPVVLYPGKKKYWLSRLGNSAQGMDEVDIEVPGIGELLSVIPDRVEIDNISIATDPESEIVLELGGDMTYSFAIDYGISCPLAFGRDLRLSYVYEIEDLNGYFNDEEDFSIDLNAAEISFTVKNTIPMNLSLSATPFDLKGNDILSGVNVSVDGTISAGTVDNPVEEPIVITVSADSETLKKVEGLKLAIIATGSSVDGIEGIPCNENQGVQLLGIKARVAGNLSTSLSDDKKNENE